MSQTESLITGSVVARLAYQRSRFHAYELGITIGQTGTAHFHDITMEPVAGYPKTGELLRTTALARLEAGTKLGLGLVTRLAPYVHVGAGIQGRVLFGATLVTSTGAVYQAPDEQVFLDLTGSAGLGLDYQISHTWSVGVGVTATRAMPLDGGPEFKSLEGAIHVSWL